MSLNLLGFSISIWHTLILIPLPKKLNMLSIPRHISFCIVSSRNYGIDAYQIWQFIPVNIVFGNDLGTANTCMKSPWETFGTSILCLLSHKTFAVKTKVVCNQNIYINKIENRAHVFSLLSLKIQLFLISLLFMCT